MSKKTNALKQAKRSASKPRRHAKRRPNPLFIKTAVLPPRGGSLFSDPIFMHHMLAILTRTLELYPTLARREYPPAVVDYPKADDGGLAS